MWPFGPEDFWIDDAISGSLRGFIGSKAAEAGQRRADEASRAQQSDRPPIAKRAIRERHGKRYGPGPPGRRRDGRDPTGSDVTGRDRRDRGRAAPT